MGELCSLINGRAFKPAEWGKEGLPIVRIQNLNDPSRPYNYFDGSFQDRHFIDNGAILLSWSGTPGTSFGCFRWTRGPALLNQHIFKVGVDPNLIDGDFFIYAVKSRLIEMISHAHGGVGLRHITKGKLEAMHLPVPSLEEQRRIVARIKECMERAEEIATLREQAVREAAYLESSHYEALEATTGAPLLPVGEVILNARNGRSISQATANANGYVLTLSAVRGVALNLAARKPIELPDSIAGNYSITVGDVFVSRSNTRDLVGLSAVAEAAPREPSIYPDLLIKLTPDQRRVLPRYLAYALRNASSREQIKARAVGTSQSMVKISGRKLKEVRVPVPSIEVQETLVERLEEARVALSSLTQAQSGPDVARLRDAILRKAFAGEL